MRFWRVVERHFVAVCSFISLCMERIRTDKALNRLILLVLLTTVLTNPVNWWARYVPQFYAFPVFVLLFLSQRKNIGWHICIYGMLSLIYINSFITHQAVLKNTFNFTKRSK